MNKTIIVLPSARSIEQLGNETKNLFLPTYMTLSDFISKLCIVPNFTTIDSDTRILLLLKASDFKEFSNLQIQRNFFTFTKNSTYIFKFFEELSAEKYDMSLLEMSNIYGEYEKHISILKELYKRYEEICLKEKFLDKIFLPKLYEFNAPYIEEHKKIELFIDGHLTNFEIELLEKCCEYSEVNIIFNTSFFNTKMQNKFLELGFSLEPNFMYKLNLNNKEIITKKELYKNENINCESFSESILQVAFVKKKIYDFLQKGYKAKDIAVILPDEKMAEILMSFDDKSNFNFVMGSSFTKSKLYEKLNATSQMIEQNTKENEARLNRIGDEFYVKLLNIYFKNNEEVDFIAFLNEYKESFSQKQEIKIFEEEVYKFKYLLTYMQNMNIKSLINLFLQRLANRTIDDMRGGKITVMGVLETRNISFDGVIIVDFNDNNVPKKSDKDMFLNDSIREMSNLPTMLDRENLQKHYYEMLMKRSKEVAISFVSSNDSSESIFLKQLNIKDENIFKESDYADIIFTKKDLAKKENKKIILPYSFQNEKLSASKLKIYLTCKRKYYYRYIKKIYNHDIPSDKPADYKLGLDIHLALKELYLKKASYDNAKLLQIDLFKELDSVLGKSEYEKYMMDIAKRNLHTFCDIDVKRFSQGWSVYKVEDNLECRFNGITLSGQIDRIDKRNNEIYILDYKTGNFTLTPANKIDEATEFQLEFYYLLASAYGNVIDCAYYDLKNSKIVPESFLNEKLEKLKSIVVDLLTITEINFELCEDEKSCIFCEYKIMCGRE
jgi:RecB family exonuclease